MLFNNLSIKVLIDCLAMKHKSFVNDFVATERANHHGFDLPLVHKRQKNFGKVYSIEPGSTLTVVGRPSNITASYYLM